MRRTRIASEAVLAEAVTSWLRVDGWRTFHEVDLPAGGRADIIALQRHRLSSGVGLVWLIETKLQAGLDVLDQALDRQRAGAHGVLVAVPGGPAALRLAAIAPRLGVGVISVDEVEQYDGRRLTLVLQPTIKAWPGFARQARINDLLKWCTPGHEAQAAGVTGAATRWTPFKAAVRKVVHALMAAPDHRLLLDELALTDAVRAYKPHHAAPQLRRWLAWAVDDKLVPGCSMVGRGKTRAVVLDPAGVTAEHRRDLQLDELGAALVVAGLRPHRLAGDRPRRDDGRAGG